MTNTIAISEHANAFFSFLQRQYKPSLGQAFTVSFTPEHYQQMRLEASQIVGAINELKAGGFITWKPQDHDKAEVTFVKLPPLKHF